MKKISIFLLCLLCIGCASQLPDDIEIVQTEPMTLLAAGGNKASLLASSEYMQSINAYCSENEISKTGDWVIIYYAEINNMRAEYSVGRIMEGPVEAGEDLKIIELPAYDKAAVVTLIGTYRSLPAVHALMEKWIIEQGYELAGNPMEIYPAESPIQPKNFTTKIVYPVK